MKYLFILAFSALTFTACNKCYECDYKLADDTSGTYCKEDGFLYDQAKDIANGKQTATDPVGNPITCH